MMLFYRSKHKGFTLVELAIVLAVAGLLFMGLWRLLAGGNQQVRDQSAAAQQEQLINAIKAYLGSASGQIYMETVGSTTASTAFVIYLPTVGPDGGTNANCISSIENIAAVHSLPAAEQTAIANICNYLPLGFTSTTTNSYNQTYSVGGLAGVLPAANTAPQSYSFMTTTSGGDTIPDSSGGRIASNIGSEGGFVYSTAVCPASAPVVTNACGSYGTWAVAPSTYGLSPASGHIATQSNMAPTQSSLNPWLERMISLPDTNNSLNSMSADLWMGLTTAATKYNIHLGPFNGLEPNGTGGGNLYLDGGSISDGTVGSISLSSNSYRVTSGAIAGTSVAAVPPLTVGAGCTKISGGVFLLPNDANCQYSLEINGDGYTEGQFTANQLFAASFFYQTSDFRLKKNIYPLKNSLDELLKLKPVDFTLKATNQEGLGFIAQDVEKVYPQLVTTGTKGMKAVNYDGLIAPMVSAIQELKQENDDLRHQLLLQKRQQDNLERRLESMSSKEN